MHPRPALKLTQLVASRAPFQVSTFCVSLSSSDPFHHCRLTVWRHALRSPSPHDTLLHGHYYLSAFLFLVFCPWGMATGSFSPLRHIVKSYLLSCVLPHQKCVWPTFIWVSTQDYISTIHSGGLSAYKLYLKPRPWSLNILVGKDHETWN